MIRARLAETLAIVGYMTLAAVAWYALAVLWPWWQALPAAFASGLVMIERVGP
jgi:hypothetical protein